MATPSVADLARWFTRRIEEGEPRRRERERPDRGNLSIVPDPSGGGWVIEGWLDSEAGSTVMRALEAAEEELLERKGDPGELDALHPRAARRADALELVIRAALSGGLDEPDRPDDRRMPGRAGRATEATGRSREMDDVSAETHAPPDGGG